MTTKREKRAERRARREPAPVPLDRIAPAPRPANRGTFRVAKANRQLALELPDLIRATKPKVNNRPGLRNREAEPEAPTKRQGEAKPRPSAAPRRATPALSMDKPDPRLKCRPKDSTPKGGSGSGRAFVPWGNC